MDSPNGGFPIGKIKNHLKQTQEIVIFHWPRKTQAIEGEDSPSVFGSPSEISRPPGTPAMIKFPRRSSWNAILEGLGNERNWEHIRW